ncbi:MAG: hypothetical protein QOE47_2148, partial [Pyrinomonadaceae bacterium]|nr:hypothetical protein [Pyrinomonadaceae bacterium]
MYSFKLKIIRLVAACALAFCVLVPLANAQEASTTQPAPQDNSVTHMSFKNRV